MERILNTATTPGEQIECLGGGSAATRLRHIEPRLKPALKYEMGTYKEQKKVRTSAVQTSDTSSTA
jgi:hypothetical protein